jgi:hypothetical protein
MLNPRRFCFSYHNSSSRIGSTVTNNFGSSVVSRVLLLQPASICVARTMEL